MLGLGCDKTYSADRTVVMQWALDEDFSTQINMTVASSSEEEDTKAVEMKDTAAHEAGMFQANAGKKSGDSNDSP